MSSFGGGSALFVRPQASVYMKHLFSRYAKLCYGISVALWISAVVIFFYGGHDHVGSLVGIAGNALALIVADASNKLFSRKKPND